MATDIETLRIKLEADVNDLKVGLAQAQSAIKGMDDNVKTADGGMKKLTSTLKGVAGAVGVAFAGNQIAQFAKDSVMAASNMAESLSKVRVVFGQGAAEVEAFGKTAAQNLGISNQAALEAAGTYGNLFQAFGLGQGEAQKMSTSLVQLAADMASFNNTSIDDAIQALRSGLSGETEPLKRFGVALNDVRLKEQALSMGLIKTTSGVLPPLIKSQAAYALIMKDTALAQGDYARTADGTANTMKTLQAQLMDAKVALGDALMPAFRGMLDILKLIIPMVQKFGEFIKNNYTEIKVFITVLTAFTAAWGAYTIAVNRAIIAQKALNLVMRLNPIGLIITGVALLAAAFVKLYNTNQKVKEAVQSFFKAIINNIARFIGAIATMAEAVSKLPGIGDKFKGVAEAIRGASNRMKDFAAQLGYVERGAVSAKGHLAELEKAFGGSGKTTTTTTTTTDTTAAEKLKEKIKKQKDDVKKIYADMNEVIKDAADARLEAEKDRDERIADIKKDNAKRIVEITKDYNERIKDIDKDYDKQKIKMLENYESVKEDIEERYKERKIDLLEKYNERVKDIEDKAAKDRTNAIKAAEEKRQSIVQQSIDRLRNAFARGAEFSIVDYFKEGKGVEGYLGNLKDQLKKIQELQKGAGELAGMGYSQTFIEQIISTGPKMGLQIIEELKKASPEQAKEIQKTFGLLETTQETGLDDLATSMNKGANLATAELRKAYAQVAIDLKNKLAEIEAALTESLLDANNEYKKLVEEADKSRKDALAKAKEDYEKALKDAYDRYIEAKDDALEAMNKALLDANEAFEEALLDAQKAFEKKIDDINASTTKKIDALKVKLAEAAALLAQLGATQAASNALSGAPVYNPIATMTTAEKVAAANTAGQRVVGDTNITINGVNLTDPQGTAQNIVTLVKYGQTVQIASTNMAGIQTTGLNAARAGIVRVAE